MPTCIIFFLMNFCIVLHLKIYSSYYLGWINNDNNWCLKKGRRTKKEHTYTSTHRRSVLKLINQPKICYENCITGCEVDPIFIILQVHDPPTRISTRTSARTQPWMQCKYISLAVVQVIFLLKLNNHQNIFSLPHRMTPYYNCLLIILRAEGESCFMLSTQDSVTFVM